MGIDITSGGREYHSQQIRGSPSEISARIQALQAEARGISTIINRFRAHDIAWTRKMPRCERIISKARKLKGCTGTKLRQYDITLYRLEGKRAEAASRGKHLIELSATGNIAYIQKLTGEKRRLLEETIKLILREEARREKSRARLELLGSLNSKLNSVIYELRLLHEALPGETRKRDQL